MANIEKKILKAIELIFNMDTGYVLDFSNKTLQEFILDSIGVDIYNDEGYSEYKSKAKKLKQILNDESDDKAIKLINDLIDYYDDYMIKYGDNFKDEKIKKLREKKLKQVKEYIDKLENKMKNKSFISDDLNKKIIMISTRNAKFEQMTDDEKLKEISNLIEYLLKEGDKYIKIDYQKNSFSFLSDENIKRYRKIIQCFRHASKDSIKERDNFSGKQKKFMINYGITITEYIFSELNNSES